MLNKGDKGSFNVRMNDALNDPQLRQNFRGAMDFLRDKRKVAFSVEKEWEELRKIGSKVRRHVINNLPELLVELEENCIRNGIQVHWAETREDANQIIGDIAQSKQAQLVIKGKSMASEEIDLNRHLQGMGIECIESDMGEYIVQIANETPSHIILPAIHKNKAEIADLFHEKLNVNCDKNDVDGMIGIGRKVLREKFKQADIGISGVNFAAAKSGTLCLVENEGNGRLSTTAPATHIAIMGIEKVIPSINELPPLQKLLTRSATGQHITTYLNLINGPRRPHELDGPTEVHLVILDNGRSKIQQDHDLNETLACIRCGACMNHCPVYTKIGGHAYGTTYPGPIGQVVMPQIEGMQMHGEILDACSLNGACGEACPVNIDLPDLIRKLRNQRSIEVPTSKTEKSIWQIWSMLNSSPKLYRFALQLLMKLKLSKLVFPSSWKRHKLAPQAASKSFQQLWKEKQGLKKKSSNRDDQDRNKS